MSTDTTSWTEAHWQGRARMAAARRYAGVPLDAVDREALRRHPQPEGLDDP